MKFIKCHAVLTEELLGTSASSKEIHEEFIAGKAPDAPSREEEVAAIGVDEVVEKSKTVFPRLNGYGTVVSHPIAQTRRWRV